MLNDFFRINLPYGLRKTDKGEWMAFNREYQPLGFNTLCNDYRNYPIATKYKKVSETLLEEVAWSEYGIKRNEKNEIIEVYLYNDEINPMNQSGSNKKAWESYFDKLKKLSKLKRIEED